MVLSRCLLLGVCYSADCVLCLQAMTKEMVSMIGTVHRNKGAHTDMKHEWYVREVALLFVVEFWRIHGDLTSEMGVYIPLFTCIVFLVVKGEASGSVFQCLRTCPTH